MQLETGNRKPETVFFRPRGSALIVAMAIVVLLAGLSTALMNTIHTRALNSEIDLEDIKAFEAAEAGVDAAINDINRTQMTQVMLGPPAAGSKSNSAQSPQTATQTSQFTIAAQTTDDPPIKIYDHTWTCVLSGGTAINSPGCLGTESWRPALIDRTNPSAPTVTTVNDDLFHPLVLPRNYISRPRWPSVQNIDKSTTGGTTIGSGAVEPDIHPIQLGDVFFFTYTVPWLHNGIDDNNDGGVDDITERGKYTVFSTGIHKGLTDTGVSTEGRVVTIEVVVESLDPNAVPSPGAALDIQL